MAEQFEMGGPGTALAERPEDGRVAVRGMAGGIGMMKLVAPIEQIIEAQNETRRFIHTALVEKRDYGIIPGTDGKRKSLLKPGAERVCAAFGTVARYEAVEQEIDHDREVHWEKQKYRWDDEVRGKKHYYVEASGVSKGLYRYVYRCVLYLGDRVVGEGVGSASTMESKYIDRPRDLENTIIKMAKKRAFIDATLTTFGLSDEFSQDFDDEDLEPSGGQSPRQERQERAQSNVQGQLDQARSKLEDMRKRQLSKADREKAAEILAEVDMIWDSLGTGEEARADDARVALNGQDVPRNEHGVPDPRALSPEHMKIVLDYVRGRANARVERVEQKQAPPEKSVAYLTVRKIGPKLHIIDPRKGKECIGCGELLTGHKMASASADPKDYCAPALGKALEILAGGDILLPQEMEQAVIARLPKKPSDNDPPDLPF